MKNTMKTAALVQLCAGVAGVNTVTFMLTQLKHKQLLQKLQAQYDLYILHKRTLIALNKT